MLNKTAGRRAVLAGAAAAFVAPGIARAEDTYPSRPIKFIVPYTPAGAMVCMETVIRPIV